MFNCLEKAIPTAHINIKHSSKQVSARDLTITGKEDTRANPYTLSKMGIAVSSKHVDYEVIVKTGDVKGAGTDSNVYIALIDEEGRKSRDIFLDCKWRDDFEKGNTDVFKVSNVTGLGHICRLELWRDSTGLNDDWFVEWIKVKPIRRSKTENKSTTLTEKEQREGIPFPCNRWIKENARFALVQYDAVLPQFDDRKSQRKDELERKRELYEFKEKAPGLPRQVSIPDSM